MKIYRAMCEQEFLETVAKGSPDFSQKRFKWFSHNLQWVQQRVQDGKFNNSGICKGRYTHLVEFEWDGQNCDRKGMFEIQFDRRKNPLIKFCKVLSIAS